MGALKSLIVMRLGRSIRLAVLMASLPMACSPGTAHAERLQQAPASRVALLLPDGFEPAQLYSGFTHEAHGVSVVIVELPGDAYDSVAKGLTADALAARGVTKAAPAPLSRPDPHVYMRGEQASPSGAYGKYFVLFREGGVTALVTANVPKAALEKRLVTEASIEKVLVSARVEATAAPTREVFRLGHLGAFKPAGSFLGTARLFTLDGSASATPPSPTKPLLIVAPSLDRQKVDKADALADRLLAGLDAVDVAVEKRRAATFGGLAGIEIEARGRDRATGSALMLYQVVVIPPEGGYFRILGQAPLAERERWLPEMRRIAESFTLVR